MDSSRRAENEKRRADGGRAPKAKSKARRCDNNYRGVALKCGVASCTYPAHHRIDPPQQVASRDAPFEVEQVKQLALNAGLSTHHGKPPPLNASSARNHCSPISAKPFSTTSTHNVISLPSIDALRRLIRIASSAVA
jgi:hypothetical protein